jgi:crotonobetainyl-CoA:carnitine CoA-transferase CaiB-like acyl-CoA transferase
MMAKLLILQAAVQEKKNELLKILAAQSRIDTARKEVNRKKALEIATNIVNTPQEAENQTNFIARSWQLLTQVPHPLQSSSLSIYDLNLPFALIFNLPIRLRLLYSA